MRIIDKLFALCVEFLLWLGKTTGFTYVEISVIFNLWIQGALLLASSALPLIVTLVKFHGDKKMNIAEFVIPTAIFLFYLSGFMWMMVHYHGTMNQIFQRCVQDLVDLAAKWHTTYNMVNIIIFIIGWLVCVSGNLLIAHKIYLAK